MGDDLGGKIEVYDIALDTWTTYPVPGLMLDLLTTGQGFPELGPSGAVFYFGGDSTTKKTVRYDVLTSQFQVLAPPPLTANRVASVRYGKYMMLLGGRIGPGTSTVTDAIQVYDTEENWWFVSPVRLPYKASDLAAGISPDGTVYISGGSSWVDGRAQWRNDAYSFHASAAYTAGISGTLDLRGHLDPASVPALVEVYLPGGTVPIATVPLALGANGELFAALGVAPGTYDLRFRARNFLAKRLRDQRLALGDNPLGTISMTNGDGDESNVVDLVDVSIALLNFNKDWDQDYDGDGMGALSDLNIPLMNFTLAGDD